MQLTCHQPKPATIRTFASPTRCPGCGDWMVAPVHSEFVVGGEIRHHWECDVCGDASSTSIPFEAVDELQAE